MKSGRLIWLALCLVGLVGCVGARESKEAFQATPQQARLTELVVQRLEVGRQVAWIKYVNKMAVRDPEREAQVLASLTKQGSQMGVNPAVTEEFFEAQIVASRMLQEQLIHKWKRGASLPAYPPMDLKRDIRPKLDYLGTELLKEIRSVRLPDPTLASYAVAEIQKRGFSRAVAYQATAPLR